MNPDTSLTWLDPEELDQLEAEAIGWIPLEEGAYLHLGDPLALVRGQEIVIEVVGLPDAGFAGVNVLLVGW